MIVSRKRGAGITIALVSHQRLFRDALTLIFQQQDDFNLLPGLTRKTPPLDLVVLDSMAIRPDANLLSDLGVAECQPRGLVILNGCSTTPVAAFLEAGVTGILDWNASSEYLCEASRRVHAGETVISISSGAQARRTTSRAGLTPRESQVVREVARGKSNVEIARALGVTENTVKGHLVNIFEKLELTNRVQVATYALENGVPEERPGESAPWDLRAA